MPSTPATMTTLYTQEGGHPFPPYAILTRWDAPNGQAAVILEYGLRGVRPGSEDVETNLVALDAHRPDWESIREAIAKYELMLEHHVLFLERRKRRPAPTTSPSPSTLGEGAGGEGQ
jgi:hypothetical protein